MEMHCVPLTTLVSEFKLEVAYAASDYEKIQLTVEDVARQLDITIPSDR